MAVQEHAVFAVPLHGTCQHLTFGITPLGGEVFNGFRVIYTSHILFNDGAFVKVCGDIVRRGADQFDAPIVRLVIRLGALEAGQERVVNVDGAARQLAAQVVRQNLHVTRQHHQLGAFRLNDLVLLGFGLGFVGRCDGNVVKGHVVAGRQLVELAVVAHNGANVDGQQAAFPAKQQIVQTMAFFADQNNRRHGLLGVVQVPGHLEGDGKTGQLAAQIGLAHLVAGKLHAHEKQAGVVVVVLGGLFNVAAAL